MNILLIQIFFLGFMVSEIRECPYSGTARIRLHSPRQRFILFGVIIL